MRTCVVGVRVAVEEAAVEIRLGTGTAIKIDAAAVVVLGNQKSHAVAEESAVAKCDVRPAGLVDGALVGAGEADVLKDIGGVGDGGGDAEDVAEASAVEGVERRVADGVERRVVGAGKTALDGERLGERHLRGDVVLAGGEEDRVAVDGGGDGVGKRHRRNPREAVAFSGRREFHYMVGGGAGAQGKRKERGKRKGKTKRHQATAGFIHGI